MKIKSFWFIILEILLVTSQSKSQVLLWENCLGGTGAEFGADMIPLQNGQILSFGSTDSNDSDVTGNHYFAGSSYDFWLCKLDSNGNLLRQKCFGGSNDELASKIIPTYDGGYILAGTTSSNNYDVVFGGYHGAEDYWVFKIDSNWNIVWQKCLGGSGNDELSSIVQLTDSGFLVVGSSYSADGDVAQHYGSNANPDIFICRINSNGSYMWGKNLGGTMPDYGVDVAQNSDNSLLILCGSSSTDFDLPSNHIGNTIVFKLDSAGGGTIWVKTFGGSRTFPRKMILNSDGSFMGFGQTASGDGDVVGYVGGMDAWLFKADSTGHLISQKCVGTHGLETGYCFQNTSDQGLILGMVSFAGDSIIQNFGSEDIWVVKLDGLWNYEWSRICGSSSGDAISSIIQMSDHEYLLNGSVAANDFDVTDNHVIFNHGTIDEWVVKFAEPYLGLVEIRSSINSASLFYKEGQVFIQFADDTNENAEVSLIDELGRIILTKKIKCSQGINRIIFPVYLNSGLKILRIQGSSGTCSLKFITN